MHGVGAILREWADALMVAFVATMFFRIFFVELFKIPSGSMTPTLIGGQIARADLNNDGHPDLVFYPESRQPPMVFLNDGQDHLLAQFGAEVPAAGIIPHERFDRILVNKMSYWFRNLQRGDIVVFKVPEQIWAKDKPIYIKRCVGLPGEELSFDGSGHLIVNGDRVTEPEFFSYWRYLPYVDTPHADIPEITYTDYGGDKCIQRIHVPGNKIYVFGDNTQGSLDSRYWGGVPLNNVKGRAFFRYWPPSAMKFLKGS
jgi:signal peptidase I